MNNYAAQELTAPPRKENKMKTRTIAALSLLLIAV
jgi:hypothetical protein